MKIEDYNKLEKEIKNQDFNGSYGRIDKVLSALSILGNFGSIFLAFFFITKLFTQSVTAISNEFVIGFIAVVLLGCLELIKREIFDKWSLEFIRSKFKMKKEVLVLVMASLLVVSISAYSSMNGAQEFSSQDDVLVEQADQDVSQYTDSLNTVFYDKITLLENQNQTLFEQNLKYDAQIEELPPNYITAKEKIRKDKQRNVDQIDKNDIKIVSIKEELSNKIKEFKDKIIKSVDNKQENNKGNSIVFIIISAFIEIVILAGIFFNKLFKFKSYTEFKEKVVKDPSYQKWYTYSQVSDMIFPPTSKVGDKVPSISTLFELSKINTINMNLAELQQCMKLFNQLKITKSSGPIRTLVIGKDQADEILKNHFKID